MRRFRLRQVNDSIGYSDYHLFIGARWPRDGDGRARRSIQTLLTVNYANGRNTMNRISNRTSTPKGAALALGVVLGASALIAGAVPATARAQDDGQKMVISVKRMTMETALHVAQAAIAQCRKEGVQVAVTVVDRNGNTQVVLRDVLAMDLTLRISRQKAYTAMSFNSPTSELAKRFTSPVSIAKVKGVLPSAGGVPIAVGGAILGGVGVSGAPSGLTDEKCAKAGVDAVRMDLEMSGM